jgi:hypothetical protein
VSIKNINTSVRRLIGNSNDSASNAETIGISLPLPVHSPHEITNSARKVNRRVKRMKRLRLMDFFFAISLEIDLKIDQRDKAP